MKKILLIGCFCLCFMPSSAQMAANATSELANALLSDRTIDAVIGAAKSNNLSALKRAISASNNEYLAANVHRYGDGKTPLMWACIRGNFAMVQYLLDKGACLDTEDKYNNTAIGYALEYKRPKTVALLLIKGASVARDMLYDSETVGTKMPLLAVALKGGLYSAAKVILSKDKRKNILNTSYDDDSLLALAAYKGYLDIVKELHARGATVDSDAVISAYSRNDFKMFSYLVSRADFTINVGGYALCYILWNNYNANLLLYVKTLVESFRRMHGTVQVRPLVNFTYTLDYAKYYSPLSLARDPKVAQYLKSVGAHLPKR